MDTKTTREKKRLNGGIGRPTQKMVKRIFIFKGWRKTTTMEEIKKSKIIDLRWNLLRVQPERDDRGWYLKHCLSKKYSRVMAAQVKGHSVPLAPESLAIFHFPWNSY